MPGVDSMQNAIMKLLVPVLIVLFFLGCGREEKFSDVIKQALDVPAEKRQALFDNYFKKHEQVPVIEDSTVYFVYLSEDTTASVYLTGDMSAWKPDSIRMKRIKGTNWYIEIMNFPENARVEYKFVTKNQWITDPLNKYRDRGGLGINSVLLMPGYAFPTEILKRKGIQYGKIDTLEIYSTVNKKTRTVYFYRNADAGADAPLLLFHDGGDYLQYGSAQNILDNLAVDGDIPPLQAVFINPLNRMREYMMNDAYLNEVFEEILLQIREKYALKKDLPTGMIGASLGGLISMYALKHSPDKLSFMISQSGAFWVDDGKIMDIIAALPAISATVTLSCGAFEGLVESNKAMVHILDEKNVKYKYEVYAEGHNWGHWRRSLKPSLIFSLNQLEH